MIAKHEVGCTASKKSALPVEHGNDRLVHLAPRRREHAGDVDALIRFVMRQRDQRLKSLQIKMPRIVGLQPRRDVIDDHRLVGIRDLSQQPAAESGKPVALRPGIEMFLESRGASNQIKRRLDIAAGNRDVIVAGNQRADVFEINIDEGFWIGDIGDGLHRAIDDGQFFLPGAAADGHGGIVELGVGICN